MIKVTLLDGDVIDIDPMCVKKVYRNENRKCTEIKFSEPFDQIRDIEKIDVLESCKFVRMKVKNYFNELQFSMFDERKGV